MKIHVYVSIVLLYLFCFLGLNLMSPQYRIGFTHLTLKCCLVSGKVVVFFELEWPGFEPRTSSVTRGCSSHSAMPHLAVFVATVYLCHRVNYKRSFPHVCGIGLCFPSYQRSCIKPSTVRAGEIPKCFEYSPSKPLNSCPSLGQCKENRF